MKPLSEQWARKFHDAYERLAPDFGYETRDDTKEFDPQSPNGRLMIAVIEELGIAQLEARSNWLAALEQAGVDNWPGWDYAAQIADENGWEISP